MQMIFPGRGTGERSSISPSGKPYPVSRVVSQTGGIFHPLLKESPSAPGSGHRLRAAPQEIRHLRRDGAICLARIDPLTRGFETGLIGPIEIDHFLAEEGADTGLPKTAEAHEPHGYSSGGSLTLNRAGRFSRKA